ncbi:hypothetical protein KAJ61_03380 [Candidatus Parcubacteria bacterium]|nr:hypothetical protein [Candidatus Parcubacteria bacterium]
MTKIIKELARINWKINKMKNQKILDFLLIIIFFISVVILSVAIVFIALTWDGAMKLILKYLLVNNLIILTIIFCSLFLFFFLLAAYRLFLVYDDIKKLPEVIISKAEKFIEEFPKAKIILTQLIHEAENKDDGKELLKTLKEFQRLRNLENTPKYLAKKAEEEIAKAKKEGDLLKKKLGLS